jgi:protein-tyrosine phosphatase
MNFPMLIVCHANVCRSQGAAILLNHQLYESQDDSRVTLPIVSRGTNAASDSHICVRILPGQVPQAKIDVLRKTVHPQVLKLRDVKDAQLILTSGLAERSAVVRMEPTARPRTFTLIEAARLSRHVLTEQSPPGYLPDVKRLEWLVQQMDASRGVLGLPSLSRRRALLHPWRTSVFSALEIPDAHREPGVGHSIVRERMVESTSLLADSLRSTLVGPKRLNLR